MADVQLTPGEYLPPRKITQSGKCLRRQLGDARLPEEKPKFKPRYRRDYALLSSQNLSLSFPSRSWTRRSEKQPHNIPTSYLQAVVKYKQ